MFPFLRTVIVQSHGWTSSIGTRPLESRFNSDTKGYDYLNCNSGKQGGPLLSLGDMTKDVEK